MKKTLAITGSTRLFGVLLGATILITGCDPETIDSISDTDRRMFEDPSWEVVYTDSTTTFIGLDAVDDNSVWAAGTNSVYIRTINGGKTWIRGAIVDAESLAFRDIHAFSDFKAFALSIGSGGDSRIYRTDDGGASWRLSFQNQDPNSFFDCLSFWDEERGFAFSDSFEGRFRLIRTMDGGETWHDIPDDVIPAARDGEGAFASSGTCVMTRPGGLGWFATGASGIDTRVIRTTDFGNTWEEAPTPIASNSTTAGVYTLAFLDDSRGIAMGGDYAARDSSMLNSAITFDGGATWVAGGRSNITGSVYGASYVPGAVTPTIVAVAPTGSDFSVDNGGSWTSFSELDFWSVDAVHVTSVWAAGPGQIGRIRLGAVENSN